MQFKFKLVALIIVCCAIVSHQSVATAQTNSKTIRIESAMLRLLYEADVPAQEAGLLLKLNVREGDTVKRGTIVAQLDDQLPRLAVMKAETELQVAKAVAENNVQIRYAAKANEMAKAELARSEESIRKFPRSISESQLDVERLNVEKSALEQEQATHEKKIESQQVQLKAREVEAAKLQVARRQIISPLDGVVVQVFAQQGEWLQPGDQTVRVVDVSTLKAEGFLSASLATRSLQGATVTVTTTNNEQTAIGKLVYVSPEVDPISRQVRVWAEIVNSDLKLRPGQRVKMIINKSGKHKTE